MYALPIIRHLMNYSRDHSVDEGLAYTVTWNSAMLQASVSNGLHKQITSMINHTHHNICVGPQRKCVR
jgi:hypothetical protein